MNNISQQIKQREAIERVAYKDYLVVITDERFNPNDYDSVMRRDSGNNAIAELFKKRKEIAKELVKGNLTETQEALDLFDYINNEIKRHLML